MKLLASTVLLGAATAAVAPQQQVLKNPFKSIEPVVDSWSKPLHTFADAIKNMPSEAKAVWDEVSAMFPEAMEQATFFSTPKKHDRKPDSAWDHVVKGADIQSIWVENSKGEKERYLDGKLDTYNMRTKRIDPSKLGIDKVKQYSGYLDDEENDKHLFYCMFKITPEITSQLLTIQQGSLNPEMTPRTTR